MIDFTIEVGKEYKTRDGEKVVCVGKLIDPPKEYTKSDYPVTICAKKEGRVYSVTLEGKEWVDAGISNSDIVEEWVKPKTTRVFKNKKELAKALMKGKKYRIDNADICHYSEDCRMPFRCGGKEIIGLWHFADGITEWTKVE